MRPVSKKIMLIVEDNKMNRQYLTRILDNWQITYDVAENGREAVEMTRRKRYDAILMDVRMPVMDGYDATRHIRSSSLNEDTLIVALTASSIVDAKDKTLAAGMDYHLSKPFTPQQLMEVFYTLHVFQAEDPDVRMSFNFSDKLDVAYLKELYDNDLERAQIIFEIYIGNIRAEVDKLEELFNTKDWPKFGVHAHKLKPNFYMVGVRELGDTMLEFEKARNGAISDVELSEKFKVFKEKFPHYHDIVADELSRLNSFLGI